jgi:DNA-binding response OmpR family regulator
MSNRERGPMTGQSTIFVVEDEESFIDALTLGLGREGFRVQVARDGAEALERFDAVDPDLVLLDVMLPKISGIDVCREIRKKSTVPIIMVTAKGSEIDTVVGLEVGADDYVAKPFDLRELLARLRAVLRRRTATAAPAAAAEPAGPALPGRRVRMGRNRLDLDMRRLFGPDGREVPLVASEFELLRAFAERPGRTLSRETLLDLAHPHGEEHFDRSIDVRITRIRRKIEIEPSHPMVIRTVRGLGYVFDPDADA